jgi:hypothetical protein
MFSWPRGYKREATGSSVPVRDSSVHASSGQGAHSWEPEDKLLVYVLWVVKWITVALPRKGQINKVSNIPSTNYSFPLWLYSPILDRTPWTGDQLVVRPLRVCPGWLWGWRSWWNERFWQGKPKYLEKSCPDAILSTTIPTCQTRARTRAAAVGSQRLTASATQGFI